MRRTLTDRGVAALRPRSQRYAFPDPELTGHYVRVQSSGSKSFVTVARTPAGKQVWTNVGAADVMSIVDAREQAREIIKRVRAGLPAVETRADTVADVVANWIKRHVEPNGLRSRREIIRMLDSHILPAWRDREFIGIKRSDVVKLLDHVEDKHGARTADVVLTVFSAVANWHAARSDDFSPPVIRGMRRQSTHAQARARILDDEEIRAIWKATETAGTFGRIVRLALLTAQRRSKVAQMRWADIAADGAWTIPKEPREKDSGGVLQLPEAALAIIHAQSRVGSNPHVFPGRGNLGPFKGVDEAKAVLSAKLPANMPGWVMHDLRRTARSLMARAGVRPDVAERVLGHAIVGVAGTYDRHGYRDEKADALARLAALIDSIVNPRSANVVPLTKPRKRRRS
jgi:integrase